MEVTEEELDSGGEVEEEVEEIEEELEEEDDDVEEEEEEEEEEVEEVEEEEEEDGGDEIEGEERLDSSGKGICNVDSVIKEIQQPVSTSSSSGKIFVGGVAWETTEETFSNHFAKYGEITDSVIMKDKNTQMPRGFGFVTFADPSVIDKLLEDEHAIDGRVVEVKRTVPKEDMPPKGGMKTKKIFVGGIPPSLTEDEFKEHFSNYGEVVEHQIMLDHSTGRSRCFGFITFVSEGSVEKIISEGRMHDLAGKQVEIKKAEPKKAGTDAGIIVRGGGGGSHGYGNGSYAYGGGYRSMGTYYGGREGGEFYGRGYAYGGGAGATGYGAGFGPGFGGSMYGSTGYGGVNAYGAAGAYGAAYGSYSSGRGYGSRHHPYGR